jgi:hypothetical protein
MKPYPRMTRPSFPELLLCALALSTGADAQEKTLVRFDGNHQEMISSDPRRYRPVEVVAVPTTDLNLPTMPRGRQTFCGTAWVVKDPVILQPGEKRNLGISGSVSAVKVLQTANAGELIGKWRATVAHTHRSHGERPDYPEVGRYVYTYADGSTAIVPLRWAEGIENGFRRTFEPVSRFIGDLGWAQVAWQGALDEEKDLWPVAYETTVPNPLPAKDVTSVAFESADGAWGEIAIFACRSEQAQTNCRYIFVAPDGSDTNPGTFDKPLGTPGKAAELAIAGSTVFLRGGRYYVDKPVMPLNSGKEGAWITFSGYPGETAIIDGSRLYTDNGDPNSPTANLYKVPFGSDTASMLASRTGAIHIFKREYIRIRNLSVHNSNYAGIAVDNATQSWMKEHPGAASHHLDFEFNRINRTIDVGLGVYANCDESEADPTRNAYCTNIRAVGNQILHAYNFDLAQASKGPGKQASTRANMRGERNANFGDENMDFHGVHHLEVGHNEVFAGGKEGIDLMINTHTARVHHNFVHDNFVYPYGRGGKACIYLDTRGGEWDIEVDHNVLRQGGVGVKIANETGKPAKNIAVHHNLCVDNLWGGFSITARWRPEDQWMEGVRFYANTAYKNGYYDANKGPAADFHVGRTDKLRDVSIENCIAVDNRDFAISVNSLTDVKKGNIRIDHNLIWPQVLNQKKKIQMGGWAVYVTNNGENLTIADPLFRNPENWNFYLKPKSEGVKAGNPSIGAAVGAFPHVKDQENTWRAVQAD